MDKNNIIPITTATPLSTVKSDNAPIWHGLEQVALSRLKPALSKWFDTMDDVIFNQSEKVDGVSQNAYFESLRWLRMHKNSIERSWVEKLNKEIVLLTTPLSKTKAKSPHEPLSLSLVENEALEEDLAIQSMVSRNLRLQGPAYEGYVARVRQVIGVDLSQTLPDNYPWPWTPLHVARAFQAALTDEEGSDSVDTLVKILLYKHWERDVLSSLHLDLLSQYLQDKGFKAPQNPISTKPIHREAPPPQSMTTQAAHPAQIGDIAPLQTSGGMPGVRLPAGMLGDLVSSHSLQEAWEHTDWKQLVELLKQVSPPLEQRTALEKEDVQLMVHALHHLSQTNQRRSQPSTGLDSKELPVEKNVLSAPELKEQLQQQLQSWTGKTSALKEQDELTLDLAAWLFEYIWQDPSLPSRVQAQLGRLQVPYIKAALADGRLLAESTHAARRLLEKFVKWGQSWSEESDPKETKIKCLHEAIDQIVDNFSPEEADFEKTLHWFEENTQESERRALVAEKRIQESADGQEKLTEARVGVVSDLHLRMQNKTIPPLIDQFIRRPWAHHLVLLWLREGKASRSYRTGVDWVLGLVSHFNPSTTVPIAHRFPLSSLKEQMFAAQATLGIDKTSLERFWELVEKNLNPTASHNPKSSPSPLEKGKAAEAIQTVEATTAAVLEATPQTDVWKVASQVTKYHAPEKQKTKMQQWIEDKLPQVQNGVWWQWKKADDQVLTIKLSWSGMFLKKTLFVNTQGHKVAEWGWTEMETMLNDGTLTPGQLRPFAERAFDALDADKKRFKPSFSSKIN